MKKPAAKQRGADRINAYLAGVDPKKRAALQKLRAQVKAAAPDAEQTMAWSMPAFRRDGVILCYAAWKDHCSIYPGGSVLTTFAKELGGFSLDRGTIRFTPEKPLPAALVKKIVKARIAEIESKKAKRKPTSANKKPGRAPASRKAETDVEAFFASLKHPLKKDIAAARAILLGVDGKIAEGVKWNSISFRTVDYFATVNLRLTDAVQFVFHRGAKSKDGGRDMIIADPKGLIKRLSSDRCLVTLGKGREIAANKAAFRAVAKAWIAQL